MPRKVNYGIDYDDDGYDDYEDYDDYGDQEEHGKLYMNICLCAYP